MLNPILVSALVVLISSCNSDKKPEDTQAISAQTTSNEASRGGLKVEITDAPFPYSYVKRADVQISKVYIRGKSGTGQRLLSDTPRNLNLVELRAGLKELLFEGDLPTGEYDQIRLIVDSASITLTDNREFPLQTPSAAQNGIKVFLTPRLQVSSGKIAKVILDFDLSKSFVLLGSPKNLNEVNGFLFKPVIRAGLSDHHAGSIGRVLSDNCSSDTSDDYTLENAVVKLEQNSEVIAETATNANGQYALFAIEPGQYEVVIESNAHNTKLMNQITFDTANTTDLGTITLEQICTTDDGGGSTTGGNSNAHFRAVVYSDNYTKSNIDDDYILSNVEVTLTDQNSNTLLIQRANSQGEVQFSILSEGSYQVKVKELYHQELIYQFTLSAGQTHIKDLRLEMMIDPNQL